jgi:hypothetical protein
MSHDLWHNKIKRQFQSDAILRERKNERKERTKRNNELDSICCEISACIIHNTPACMGKLKVHLINSKDAMRLKSS